MTSEPAPAKSDERWRLVAPSDIVHELPTPIHEAIKHSRHSNPELWRLAEDYANQLIAARHVFEGKPCLFIRLPRSTASAAWMIAASLAHWAFAPMDPANPIERDAELFKDAGFSAWASNSGLELFPKTHRPWPQGCEYAAFTSGSGGAPKCAMIPLGALARVASAQATLFGYGPGLSCGWCLSPGWDASLSDVFAPLAAGAILAPFEGNTSDFFKLRHWIAQGIDAIDLPCAYLPLLRPSDAPKLRRIVYGGDLANPNALGKWHGAGASLFNCYGPTETAICASAKAWNKGDDPRDIGQPIAGSKILLSSEGQIAIGGPNAMIGYRLARDGDPLFLFDGLRAYPCADLGSFEDGKIFFHGRLSRSVKIDGIFVNPEIIENALREAGVEAASILSGNRALVFVPKDVFDQSALASALSRKLPASIVARIAWHPVEALARLANGKPDLKAMAAEASE